MRWWVRDLSSWRNLKKEDSPPPQNPPFPRKKKKNQKGGTPKTPKTKKPTNKPPLTPSSQPHLIRLHTPLPHSNLTLGDPPQNLAPNHLDSNHHASRREWRGNNPLLLPMWERFGCVLDVGETDSVWWVLLVSFFFFFSFFSEEKLTYSSSSFWFGIL